MSDSKVMSVFMTLLAAMLILGFVFHSTIPDANAQSLRNDSSVSSSTVCMNDQPCRTIICNENQPCATSTTPNIPNPYEDYLDAREDMLEDDFE
jgi:hypothetical protein